MNQEQQQEQNQEEQLQSQKQKSMNRKIPVPLAFGVIVLITLIAGVLIWQYSEVSDLPEAGVVEPIETEAIEEEKEIEIYSISQILELEKLEYDEKEIIETKEEIGVVWDGAIGSVDLDDNYKVEQTQESIFLKSLKDNREIILVEKITGMEWLKAYSTSISNIFKIEIYGWDFGVLEDIYFNTTNEEIFRNRYYERFDKRRIKITKKDFPEIMVAVKINNPCEEIKVSIKDELGKKYRPAEIIDIVIGGVLIEKREGDKLSSYFKDPYLEEKALKLLEEPIEVKCSPPSILGSFYNDIPFLKIEEIKKDFSLVKISFTLGNITEKDFYINFLPDKTLEIIKIK